VTVLTVWNVEIMPKAKPDQVIVHRIELQETERATLEAALAGRFVTNAVGAAGSVLSGIGAALAPFSGAITALTAVWIGTKTWDELKQKVLDPIIDLLQAPVLARYAGDYQMIVAWLTAQYSNQGWGFLQTDNSSVDAYMNSAEGQSQIWRDGVATHPQFGMIRPAQYGTTWISLNPQSYTEEEHRAWTAALLQSSFASNITIPSWLVDRFDAFIFTMKQPTAADKSQKTPAEWWVQFYTYAEFENEIIWYAKNR